MVAGKPICILTWAGSEPALKSVMLNSHIDVVPVSESNWDHDPFGAVKLPNGDIVARGAQDMKCVGIGYLEAIRVLKAKGVVPKRTVHAVFVPDEEIGGADGMEKWVETDDFRSLNVAFALDEGLSNEENAYKVYYGERAPWWIKITAKGGAGHGSKFIEPSATERLVRTLDKFVAFRNSEKQRLAVCRNEFGRPLRLGDVTTTNITLMNAGVQFNVVPEEAWAGVDMRVAPSVNLTTFREQVVQWGAEEGTTIEFVQAFMSNAATPLNDGNLWWQKIRSVAEQRGVELDPEIFPAATDSRFLRKIGLPAIGISCIRNTPVLLHDHNEYLNEKLLIEGVEFYAQLIPELASVPATADA
ncbi:adenylate cyclase [Polyrhizophydium stewartii]|uniref:N-acyl-aliphatic-L-amino acid amidohydrolase n=1 Tax=Polyrhizophydium stewartii TaxID=2732419 RepID=A0ABR4N7N7_9FUNG